MTLRLILVRHGQTACNTGDIWHGWDDCSLTEIGLQQAEAVAARLASEPVAAVYSSDTRRAWQTASAIAARHSLNPIPEDRLRERNAGEYEGVAVTDIVARYPTLWEERAADYWGWRPPAGESLQEVLERALGVIEKLKREYDGRTAVAVSHMATTRTLISYLAGIPMERTFDLEFPSTGVSIFRIGDTVEAEAINDGAHVVA